jgi:hypothetical protein
MAKTKAQSGMEVPRKIIEFILLGPEDSAPAGDRCRPSTKEHQRKASGSKKPVRPNWSRDKQSLAAFFKGHKLAAGQKICASDPTKPHVIDLLDPLGY